MRPNGEIFKVWLVDWFIRMSPNNPGPNNFDLVSRGRGNPAVSVPRYGEWTQTLLVAIMTIFFKICLRKVKYHVLKTFQRSYRMLYDVMRGKRGKHVGMEVSDIDYYR